MYKKIYKLYIKLYKIINDLRGIIKKIIFRYFETPEVRLFIFFSSKFDDRVLIVLHL